MFQATTDERINLKATASVTRTAMANFNTAGVNFTKLALDSLQYVPVTSNRTSGQERETRFFEDIIAIIILCLNVMYEYH